MTSYDPDPDLPDDVSIDKVRLPPRIKWALLAAGLKTVGDVRKTSDATLLGIQKLGQRSLTRLRNELGRRDPNNRLTKAGPDWRPGGDQQGWQEIGLRAKENDK
jgi:DNA-directed RNA polymerase alpha subunit